MSETVSNKIKEVPNDTGRETDSISRNSGGEVVDPVENAVDNENDNDQRLESDDNNDNCESESVTNTNSPEPANTTDDTNLKGGLGEINDNDNDNPEKSTSSNFNQSPDSPDYPDPVSEIRYRSKRSSAAGHDTNEIELQSKLSQISGRHSMEQVIREVDRRDSTTWRNVELYTPGTVRERVYVKSSEEEEKEKQERSSKLNDYEQNQKWHQTYRSLINKLSGKDRNRGFQMLLFSSLIVMIWISYWGINKLFYNQVTDTANSSRNSELESDSALNSAASFLQASPRGPVRDYSLQLPQFSNDHKFLIEKCVFDLHYDHMDEISIDIICCFQHEEESNPYSNVQRISSTASRVAIRQRGDGNIESAKVMLSEQFRAQLLQVFLSLKCASAADLTGTHFPDLGSLIGLMNNLIEPSLRSYGSFLVKNSLGQYYKQPKPLFGMRIDSSQYTASQVLVQPLVSVGGGSLQMGGGGSLIYGSRVDGTRGTSMKGVGDPAGEDAERVKFLKMVEEKLKEVDRVIRMIQVKVIDPADIEWIKGALNSIDQSKRDLDLIPDHEIEQPEILRQLKKRSKILDTLKEKLKGLLIEDTTDSEDPRGEGEGEENPGRDKRDARIDELIKEADNAIHLSERLVKKVKNPSLDNRITPEKIAEIRDLIFRKRDYIENESKKIFPDRNKMPSDLSQKLEKLSTFGQEKSRIIEESSRPRVGAEDEENLDEARMGDGGIDGEKRPIPVEGIEESQRVLDEADGIMADGNSVLEELEKIKPEDITDPPSSELDGLRQRWEAVYNRIPELQKELQNIKDKFPAAESESELVGQLTKKQEALVELDERVVAEGKRFGWIIESALSLASLEERLDEAGSQVGDGTTSESSPLARRLFSSPGSESREEITSDPSGEPDQDEKKMMELEQKVTEACASGSTVGIQRVRELLAEILLLSLAHTNAWKIYDRSVPEQVIKDKTNKYNELVKKLEERIELLESTSKSEDVEGHDFVDRSDMGEAGEEFEDAPSKTSDTRSLTPSEDGDGGGLEVASLSGESDASRLSLPSLPASDGMLALEDEVPVGSGSSDGIIALDDPRVRDEETATVSHRDCENWLSNDLKGSFVYMEKKVTVTSPVMINGPGAKNTVQIDGETEKVDADKVYYTFNQISENIGGLRDFKDTEGKYPFNPDSVLQSDKRNQMGAIMYPKYLTSNNANTQCLYLVKLYWYEDESASEVAESEKEDYVPWEILQNEIMGVRRITEKENKLLNPIESRTPSVTEIHSLEEAGLMWNVASFNGRKIKHFYKGLPKNVNVFSLSDDSSPPVASSKDNPKLQSNKYQIKSYKYAEVTSGTKKKPTNINKILVEITGGPESTDSKIVDAANVFYDHPIKTNAILRAKNKDNSGEAIQIPPGSVIRINHIGFFNNNRQFKESDSSATDSVKPARFRELKIDDESGLPIIIKPMGKRLYSVKIIPVWKINRRVVYGRRKKQKSSKVVEESSTVVKESKFNVAEDPLEALVEEQELLRVLKEDGVFDSREDDDVFRNDDYAKEWREKRGLVDFRNKAYVDDTIPQDFGSGSSDGLLALLKGVKLPADIFQALLRDLRVPVESGSSDGMLDIKAKLPVGSGSSSRILALEDKKKEVEKEISEIKEEIKESEAGPAIHLTGGHDDFGLVDIIKVKKDRLEQKKILAEEFESKIKQLQLTARDGSGSLDRMLAIKDADHGGEDESTRWESSSEAGSLGTDSSARTLGIPLEAQHAVTVADIMMGASFNFIKTEFDQRGILSYDFEKKKIIINKNVDQYKDFEGVILNLSELPTSDSNLHLLYSRINKGHSIFSDDIEFKSITISENCIEQAHSYIPSQSDLDKTKSIMGCSPDELAVVVKILYKVDEAKIAECLQIEDLGGEKKRSALIDLMIERKREIVKSITGEWIRKENAKTITDLREPRPLIQEVASAFYVKYLFEVLIAGTEVEVTTIRSDTRGVQEFILNDNYSKSLAGGKYVKVKPLGKEVKIVIDETKPIGPENMSLRLSEGQINRMLGTGGVQEPGVGGAP